jgi:hypothetical protein
MVGVNDVLEAFSGMVRCGVNVDVEVTTNDEVRRGAIEVV